MNKYIEALNTLMNEYDAYYIENKYGEGTHLKEFEILSELEGRLVPEAIAWIKNCYDCYYKNNMNEDDSSAFAYLRTLAERKGLKNNE